MLLRVVGRIERHHRRKAVLRMEDEEVPDDPEANLAASAASGATPPAGPQWRFGLPLPERRELAYDKPLVPAAERWNPYPRPLRDRNAGASTLPRPHTAPGKPAPSSPGELADHVLVRVEVAERRRARADSTWVAEPSPEPHGPTLTAAGI
jgi:hypothetical protein